MKLRLLALAAAMVLAGVACSGDEVKPVGRLAYSITRTWSNGNVERADVYGNGAVVMEHGDYTEKIKLPEEQMALLRSAADGGVAAGASGGDPVVAITIQGGDEVRPAAITEGSLAELLNRLLDDHTLAP